jgi:hypothetical protein
MPQEYPFIYLGHNREFSAVALLFSEPLDKAARSSIKKKFGREVTVNKSSIKVVDIMDYEFDKFVLIIRTARLFLNLSKKGMKKELEDLLFPMALKIIKEFYTEYSFKFCIAYNQEKGNTDPWHLWSLAQLESIILPVLEDLIIEKKIKITSLANILNEILTITDFSKCSNDLLEKFLRLIFASEIGIVE